MIIIFKIVRWIKIPYCTTLRCMEPHCLMLSSKKSILQGLYCNPLHLQGHHALYPLVQNCNERFWKRINFNRFFYMFSFNSGKFRQISTKTTKSKYLYLKKFPRKSTDRVFSTVSVSIGHICRNRTVLYRQSSTLLNICVVIALKVPHCLSEGDNGLVMCTLQAGPFVYLLFFCGFP